MNSKDKTKIENDIISNDKIKLFISYSHKDEDPFIYEFNKHIAPLKEKLVEVWYDREIDPGEDFDLEISNNLEDAEIICLFISANFFDSPYCMGEKNKSLELKTLKGISVIPIILSHCAWQDYKEISSLLAIPEDGRPVSSFPDINEAFFEIYKGLKKIVEKENLIKQLKISHEFYNEFLQDSEMLTKAHSQKETIFLDDIFVYPRLDKFDFSKKERFEEKIDLNELIENYSDYRNIVIAGENQSGKTSICKTIFKELFNKKFVPVYIDAKKNPFKKNIEDTISRFFNQQYDGVDIQYINKNRIIPIIDDFHFAKDKERHINDLSGYDYSIIIVDDIFGINIEDQKYIGSFTRFKIREFNASLRDRLIKKWISLSDKSIRDNDIYKDIDEKTELIDYFLGKTIGKGVMPAYPFYILTAIINYESLEKPLEKEITSQGYFYQILIFHYFNNNGVKGDEIDIYINFLTEFSYYLFNEKKNALSPSDFERFMKDYSEKFNLPIKQETLLKKLSNIIFVNSFNNRLFKYPYFYYFFVAKYLAEHIGNEEIDEQIENLMENLHVDENAYIAIFIAHHSRNSLILNKIENIALDLFRKYEPATLKRDEVKFFDEEVNLLVNNAVLATNTSAESVRKEMLKNKDNKEESELEYGESANGENSLERELRRAIKTVEVIGCIIKNRSGSLEKRTLETVFKEAMNVHLRMMSSFFDIIKNKDGQKDIIDGISRNLRKTIEKNEGSMKKPTNEELRKIAKSIFWNMNFILVTGVISKIVHSLGSDKLIMVVNEVCDEINTPASFMVKQGISMWYEKSLELDELEKRRKKNDFSKIAKISTNLMIAEYCSLHQIGQRERQTLENKFGFKQKKLLTSARNELDK